MVDEKSYLTLTYDNEHLPKENQLQKEHLQKFFRSIRDDGYKIRYFAAGEYGETGGRAHYHAALYGIGIGKNSEYLGKSKTGFPMYRNEYIQKKWSKGNTYSQDLTFESAAYIGRYVTKKLTGPKKIEGIVQPFAIMSRKPGIGAEWLKQFQSDVYPAGSIVSRGKLVNPPRYFDKKYKEFLESIGREDIYEDMKQKRAKNAPDLNWRDLQKMRKSTEHDNEKINYRESGFKV